MSRSVLILIGAGALVVAFFVLRPSPPPAQPREDRSSRLSRISPSLVRDQREEGKPYLMLHIEDLKKCFPRILSDAREEELVTLDDIMVEVQKVFLPATKEELFHLLKFKNPQGEEMALRVTSGSSKGPELFLINEKKEWLEQKLDPSLASWPLKALFRHFATENEVIDEEIHYFQRGRGGEQINYKESGDHIVELKLYSPLRGRRLDCSRREPKAILCFCAVEEPAG